MVAVFTIRWYYPHMKYLKQAGASIAVVAVLGVGASAIQLYPRQDDSLPVANIATETEEVMPKPTEEPAQLNEEVTNPAPLPASQPVALPDQSSPKAALSIQEYANRHLSLGQMMPDMVIPVTGQDCLNALVAAFPERFTEDVRERNIKALSVYGNPCATGYGSNNPTAKLLWDTKYPGGSFFDSPIAQSRW